MTYDGFGGGASLNKNDGDDRGDFSHTGLNCTQSSHRKICLSVSAPHLANGRPTNPNIAYFFPTVVQQYEQGFNHTFLFGSWTSCAAVQFVRRGLVEHSSRAEVFLGAGQGSRTHPPTHPLTNTTPHHTTRHDTQTRKYLYLIHKITLSFANPPRCMTGVF